MSNAARNILELREKVAPNAEGRYLGPGVVVSRTADKIVVSLENGRKVETRSAMPWPYEAAVGDELLIVGEQKFYVIGVLQGSGVTKLAFEGDVELRAKGGRLHLASDKELSIDAPDVGMRADRLTIVADAANKIVGTLRQTVRDLFTLRAKEHHTLVEGTSLQHAKSTRIVSEEKVTVNGKEIYLG